MCRRGEWAKLNSHGPEFWDEFIDTVLDLFEIRGGRGPRDYSDAEFRVEPERGIEMTLLTVKIVLCPR